jgi:two-component system sensor histidine kinase KdpD
MLVEYFKGSPAYRLLYARSDFEIHLITPTTETKEKEESPSPKKSSFKLSDYLISTVMVLAVSLFNFMIQRIIEPSSFVYLYLIATITSALLYGIWPSVFASFLSLLVFDYLFMSPRYTLSMSDPREIVNVLVFLFTSVIVGQLVKVVKRQNLALQLRLERVTLIEEMSKEFLNLPPLEQLVGGLASFSGETMNTVTLLRTTILNDISTLTIKYVQRVIDVPCFVSFKEKEGELQVWAKSDPAVEINANDMAVAKWTSIHGKITGAGTETLPSIQYFFFPIKSQEEAIGMIGIKYEYKNLLPEQRRILGTISNLTSLTAARWVKI